MKNTFNRETHEIQNIDCGLQMCSDKNKTVECCEHRQSYLYIRMCALKCTGVKSDDISESVRSAKDRAAVGCVYPDYFWQDFTELPGLCEATGWICFCSYIMWRCWRHTLKFCLCGQAWNLCLFFKREKKSWNNKSHEYSHCDRSCSQQTCLVWITSGFNSQPATSNWFQQPHRG